MYTYSRRKKVIAVIATVCAIIVSAALCMNFAKASELPTCYSKKDIIRQNVNGILNKQGTVRYQMIGTSNLSNSQSGYEELCEIDDGLHVDADYAKGQIKTYMFSANGNVGLGIFQYEVSKTQEALYQKTLIKALKKIRFTSSQKTNVWKIYNYVAHHVSYDYKTKPVSYTGYGAAVKHKAVCYGYAQMFYTMCRDKGIPCRIISGNADGGYHAWNIVKLGSKWYICDVTYDDGDKDRTDRDYFLIGSTKAHRTMDAPFRTAEFKKNFPISKSSYKEKKKTTTKKKTSRSAALYGVR